MHDCFSKKNWKVLLWIKVKIKYTRVEKCLKINNYVPIWNTRFIARNCKFWKIVSFVFISSQRIPVLCLCIERFFHVSLDHNMYNRRPEVSTNQAYLSGFYFRIALILMEQSCFFQNYCLGFIQDLRIFKIKYEKFGPKI